MGKQGGQSPTHVFVDQLTLSQLESKGAGQIVSPTLLLVYPALGSFLKVS